MQTLICLICEIPLTGRKQKYCSKSCSAKGTQSWKHQAGTKRFSECAECGTLHKRHRSPYCSDECKEKTRVRRHMDKFVLSDTPTRGVKQAAVDIGLLEEKCYECGLTEWKGVKGIKGVLQLDHINGNACDNRIENLRLLCANCHCLTDTFCGRNKGNGTRPSTYVKQNTGL